MFTHGNVVVLESTATNKSLRIRDGIVEGTGGRGQLAQFTVHVRRPGVIALQNVKHPDQYLAIYDGSTIGNVWSVVLKIIAKNNDVVGIFKGSQS